MLSLSRKLQILPQPFLKSLSHYFGLRHDKTVTINHVLCFPSAYGHLRYLRYATLTSIFSAVISSLSIFPNNSERFANICGKTTLADIKCDSTITGLFTVPNHRSCTSPTVLQWLLSTPEMHHFRFQSA